MRMQSVVLTRDAENYTFWKGRNKVLIVYKAEEIMQARLALVEALFPVVG